ncbi:Exodeoxyribonuclease 7 small subunit [Gemmatirosa kalamazoonensis]|uniref:Exodeoxyribonuclease 7 small subunit n=1 Tax=Gemmatirosa kalamazoonensis TaxID=861299 RepID=W0RKW9_9BACT|nr:exodeoxyribonuclease VII small subunit [Gemmatirosa kalamazoonensis]AHG90975.1 Exodeoxyribonuclease 7 small subunit [Gemmatirosa kalamazoonensis]
MTFEENLERLEEIVDELGGDALELDRALRLFEEGIERLREASGELARVEQQVKLLVERSDGTFELPPLER